MMKTIPVDKKLLETFLLKLPGRIKYKLGAKAPSLGCDSSAIKQIDCSGFVRWLIYRITSGKVTMPDGSYNQAAWCKSQGFKLTPYVDNAKWEDNRLRIAFIPAYRGSVGHVWLIWNGATFEAYGGKGVGRRSWKSGVLPKKVSACYVLTDKLE